MNYVYYYVNPVFRTLSLFSFSIFSSNGLYFFLLYITYNMSYIPETKGV
jgi:hypothetical protein